MKLNLLKRKERKVRVMGIDNQKKKVEVNLPQNKIYNHRVLNRKHFFKYECNYEGR